MTSVSFDSYHERYLFECSGHTGYGEAGCDILCSAVSVLCYTLREYLSNAFDEGIIPAYEEHISEGEVRFEFEAGDGERDGVLSCVRAILAGFILLSESYPDYIDASV